MANATKTDISVIRTEKVNGVVLELTIEEAEVVRDVLGSVSGDLDSRRAISGAIYRALGELIGYPKGFRVNDLTGTLFFSRIK